MPYVGQDWSPIDPTMIVVVGLDFVQDLQAGDSLLSVTADMVLLNGTDPDPDHLIGSTQIFGTQGLQMVGNILAPCQYAIIMTATTTNGETLSLWSSISGDPLPPFSA